MTTFCHVSEDYFKTTVILTSAFHQRFKTSAYNEIHSINKPSEALLSQVFQVVAESNQKTKRALNHEVYGFTLGVFRC